MFFLYASFFFSNFVTAKVGVFRDIYKSATYYLVF